MGDGLGEASMKGGDFWGSGWEEEEGLWRTSGGGLDLSTDGRWTVSIFLNATETKQNQSQLIETQMEEEHQTSELSK